MPPAPRRRALGAAAAVVLVSGLIGAEVAARPAGHAAVDAAAAPAATDAAPPPTAGLHGAVGSEDRITVDVTVEVEAGTIDYAPEVLLGGGTPATGHVCGADDRPETGVQGDVPLTDQLSGRAGEGYTCGLSLVGASTLGGRGGNANMAWVGDCAYVTGEGVAVVDASDPTNPVHVTTLHGPGSDMTIETIAAVDLPGRRLLAAGRYGFQFDFGLSGQAPVDLYDVSDCAAPRLLATAWVPGAVHNLTFSADGRRLWSTLPLQALDTTDPANPVYLGSLDDQLRSGGPFHLQYAHEVRPSPDGRYLYVGGQEAVDEATMVLDVSNWPAEPPRLVSHFTGAGHSVTPVTVDGRSYVLHADESVAGPLSNGCVPSAATPAGGPSEPILTDITDPANPVHVATLNLAINQPEHCLDALASGVNGSAHYHDVDDPTDTTFAMVSMWNSGLRLFDVRDPANPTEVAYFNPGQYEPGALGGFLDFFGVPSRGIDQAWSHVRYRPETGQIWLATRTGGFWVLELQPALRAALDLPTVPALHPDGGPARTPVAAAGQPAPPALAGSGDALLYCTLGRAAGLTAPG